MTFPLLERLSGVDGNVWHTRGPQGQRGFRDSTPAALTIRGPLATADARVLLEQAERLMLAFRDEPFVCLVDGVVDLSVVDALAHVQLLAGRFGTRLVVRAPNPQLDRLLALTGLKEAAGMSVERLGPAERDRG